MKKLLTLLAATLITVSAWAFYPSALSATVVKPSNIIHLTWTDTAQGETGWEVQTHFMRTKTHTWIDWNTLQPLPPDATAVDVEYALKGYYSFRVRPLGEGSPWSNVVTVYIK